MHRFARSRRTAGVVLAAAALVVFGAVASAHSDAPGPPSGGVLAELAKPPAYASIASQRIYFVMTDRYRNGDRSNDEGGMKGSRDDTGYDPTDPGYFHGGDLEGLTGNCTSTTDGLARLKALGFTAIWVTPPVVNKAVQAGSAGYHGYWGLDFLDVDPHLGTNQDFARFVACAHKLGLKVYQDIVVNHTADVNLLLGGSQYSTKPYRNCRGKRFDPGKYVGGHFPCMKVSNMPHRAFIPVGDKHLRKPGWMNNVLRYHNRGDIDFGFCGQTCFEQGDFFGLDDLFTEQPSVMRGLADVYASWISRFKVDGFRVDTARHVNAAFFRLWVPRIMAAAQKAGVKNFQIFGEVAVTDDTDLSRYVRSRGLPNVLDFPFQDAAAGLAAGSTSSQLLADRLIDDDYFHHSARIAPTPPTFLGNHDMGRAALQIRQRSGAEGGVLLRRDLLGLDLMYLLRGAPVVYYGDEVGMMGTGGDKAARQDMFPTQVDDWKTEERVGSPAIGDGSSFNVVNGPIEKHLVKLGALRSGHAALSTGATVIRKSGGQTLVVSRIDVASRREYVAAFNSGSSAATVTFATATPSSAWSALLGTGTFTSNSAGGMKVTVPALGALLLEAGSTIPAATPQAPRLAVGRDGLTNLWRATAIGTGKAPVTVSFAVRRRSGGWTLLSADDSPPYRAFFAAGRFQKKERVSVVAIVRSLSGRTALSPVTTFVPRPK